MNILGLRKSNTKEQDSGELLRNLINEGGHAEAQQQPSFREEVEVEELVNKLASMNPVHRAIVARALGNRDILRGLKPRDWADYFASRGISKGVVEAFLEWLSETCGGAGGGGESSKGSG
ncbi:hypothetical protein [Vulcanisaeta thermophila]|uniref:hypothetical protein n=1 Tax=Vulcanisaeta thermophila TaxID=867917 RepID=UPI0008531F3C|nr:hypothetical protein [Vulcanisaeta thermophila]